MKIARMLLVTAALSLVSASAALAGPKTLASAPAAAYYPTGGPLRCNILNMDINTQDVIIEAVDYSGTVISSSPLTSLAPQTGTSFIDATQAAAYCRFTVNTSTKKFRAVAVYENATSYTAANVAD